MSDRAALLTAILAFLPTRGITETTFGRFAVNDGKFVGRLRDGENMTYATVEKAWGYLRAEQARLAAASPEAAEAA